MNNGIKYRNDNYKKEPLSLSRQKRYSEVHQKT